MKDSSKEYKFDLKGEKVNLTVTTYMYISRLEDKALDLIKKICSDLLNDCWGSFPDSVVNEHLLKADKVMIASVSSKNIGLIGMSTKTILGRKIYYIEFLLIAKDFQRCGLGSFLSFVMIRETILKNILQLLVGKPLEVFFITPNIRLLSRVARLADYVYPNPFLADTKGKIEPADDETWGIAREVLRLSDQPQRKLEREGLVLHESYSQAPWLIYNNSNAPWHASDHLNLFAKRYLKYHEGLDREFMVRAHIGFLSLIKYITL